MRVSCLSSLETLRPYADDWDRLAGNMPFRSWAWLTTWWRHYGPTTGREASPTDGGKAGKTGAMRLFVPSVFDEADRLIGVAPWYIERLGPCGSVVRPLGSGEVCSENLGIMVEPGMEAAVADALANYLTDVDPIRQGDLPAWDLMELSDVDASDRATDLLVTQMAERGYAIHRCRSLDCWRLELPATWDAYLMRLSKTRRRRIRSAQRKWYDTGRFVQHTVQRIDELPRAYDTLVALHQRRWNALGKPGCFASERFAAFHKAVMPELLRAGQLRLEWFECDGRPVVAEYQLLGAGTIFAYQAGIDPDALAMEPGSLVMGIALRQAIEQGYRTFDMLRGSEPYKGFFRAVPEPMYTIRIVPNRVAARLRQGAWQIGRFAKQGVKKWLDRGRHLVKAAE